MIAEKLIYFTAIYFGLFTSTFFLLTYFDNLRRLKNPEVTKHPKVTIAVSMYNAGDHLFKTVDSLLMLDWPKDKLEIIIVDDGSTDDSYKNAKRYANDNRILLLRQENKGKSRAINRALKLSTGEYFGVLDVDSFATRDCLKRMMGYFENSEVMAVTPSLKIYGAKTWLQKIQMIEFLAGVYLRKVFSYLGAIHVTPGCFSIYRKSFFNKTGPYDEQNLTEDIEIACRIQCSNYLIENAIDANVYTTGLKNMKHLSSQRLRWYKGFIDNVMNYKRIFQPKYGNLGLFVLPSAFISVFLAVLLSGYMLFSFGQSVLDKYGVMANTGFDIAEYFKLNLDLFYFNLNDAFILGMLTLALSLFVLKLANRHSRGKQQPVVLPFVLFIFTYLFLYAFWWITAGYYRLSGKKVHWGNRDL